MTADARVRFVPPPGRSGVFRCAYEIVNTRGLTATADIIVTVQEAPVVNQPPIVVDERVTVETSGSIVVDVLANDSDPDGSPEAQCRVVDGADARTRRRDGG